MFDPFRDYIDQPGMVQTTGMQQGMAHGVPGLSLGGQGGGMGFAGAMPNAFDPRLFNQREWLAQFGDQRRMTPEMRAANRGQQGNGPARPQMNALAPAVAPVAQPQTSYPQYGKLWG